ncbi:SERPIN domain-containing protein [Podarcis lilfordi]|uniref:Leukocyte elastase inhibitor n=1 Tax=Podarcis lilfordi TaxID=74358 RepID=A0AA35KM42_9SAUR|nr:SERPIN domain-containing protein [Podarcis lilfordi]
MDSLSVANGSFLLDLYKKLIQSSEGNIFFSPWSITSVLAMVHMGARGRTASQMAEVLRFNASSEESERPSQEPGLSKDETINSQFQELISKINQPNNTYLLKTANRVYGEKTFDFNSEYLQLTKKYYHAELQPVDFLNAAEQVRDQINVWVEKQTDNKIKNLLPKDSVGAQTALVIVNAIYFKGKWEKRFEKANTTEKPFRLSKTQSKPVQMMFLKGTLPTFYIDILRVRILELPYENNDVSMFIMLPDDIEDESTGLEMLEKELTYERLSIWTSSDMMQKRKVELHLPRIKLEESFDLKSTLSSMGMKDAFIPGQANFLGMSKKGDLALSEVYHKSFVEINEEGTEAAAASAATIVIRSSQKPIKFEANHPFIFFIKHKATKTTLFLGRFSSP